MGKKTPNAENSTELSKRKQGEWLKPYHFQPGQSGNPGGRPKEKPVTDLLRQLFDNPEDFLMIANQVRGVFKGKSGMAKVMLLKDAAERLEGKISQRVDVNGELTHTVSIAADLKEARERATKK